MTTMQPHEDEQLEHGIQPNTIIEFPSSPNFGTYQGLT